MASTLLEETRQAHDDIERLERLIVKDFSIQQPTAHKEKLLQSHRVRSMLDSMQERSAKLVRAPVKTVLLLTWAFMLQMAVSVDGIRGTGRVCLLCVVGRLPCMHACPLHPPPHSHVHPHPHPHPHQIRIYDDEDRARKEEIAQLRLGGSDNIFTYAGASSGWHTCRRCLPCQPCLPACPPAHPRCLHIDAATLCHMLLVLPRNAPAQQLLRAAEGGTGVPPQVPGRGPHRGKQAREG